MIFDRIYKSQSLIIQITGIIIFIGSLVHCTSSHNYKIRSENFVGVHALLVLTSSKMKHMLKFNEEDL